MDSISMCGALLGGGVLSKYGWTKDLNPDRVEGPMIGLLLIGDR